MRILYNAALLPARAASLVFGVWPRGTEEAALERDQRLARRLPSVPQGPLWIHGASVGEARLIGALAREIRSRRPGLPIVASAVTRTGRAQIPSPPAIEAAFILPLDFKGVQKRAFDAVSPAMLVLIETELWPNLLSEAAARGVPVAMVNARLAPERLARYRRLAGLYAPLLRGLRAIGAAGRDEAERFAALGVPMDAIRIVGNMKFDLPAALADAPGLRLRFGLPAGRPVVAAGSTGEGEDAIVLDAFVAARKTVFDLLLILAPRHPSRFDMAAAECGRRGLSIARLSGGGSASAANVLLVDTMGELASLYALAGSAFVGGSLVPVGGHNLLEPLAAGTPVLFGPHTDHVAEIASALERAGAGTRVADAAALGRAWVALAMDEAERSRRVAAGAAFLAANRGALARAADLVLEVWDRAPAKVHA